MANFGKIICARNNLNLNILILQFLTFQFWSLRQQTELRLSFGCRRQQAEDFAEEESEENKRQKGIVSKLRNIIMHRCPEVAWT